jgi:integrase
LCDALLADYKANGRKWLRQGKDGKAYIVGLPNLNDYFEGWRAAEITTDAIRAFIRKRQDEHRANGTINRELALLRRMLRLAVQDGKLRDVPHFPMLQEAAARKGFLDHAGYQKLRQELPGYLRPVLAMGYFTGMRKAEILKLRWSNVDLLGAEIRLDAGTTKSGEPRSISITGELLEMLRIERKRNPDVEYVFARDGESIGSFFKAWKSAAKRAGLPGLLFHDLRRTAIRNMVRSGTPEGVSMAISGHKTRAVFDRYNIVSGRDLKDAATKLETYLASQKVGDNSGTIAPSGEGQAESIKEQVTYLQ